MPMPVSRYVYDIAPQGAFCKLTFSHFDLPEAQLSGVSDGWLHMLSGQKSSLETGKDTNFRPENAT